MTHVSSGPAGMPSGPPGRLPAEPGALFAYGTLTFPDVLVALLGRVPAHTPASAPGWRVAALHGRLYPVLVPGGGVADGVLISGLTVAEWRVIDAYEDDFYDLAPLTLADGRRALAYLTRDHAAVLPADWSPGAFRDGQLAGFAARCAAWRRGQGV
jgi:hypothetical protein